MSMTDTGTLTLPRLPGSGEEDNRLAHYAPKCQIMESALTGVPVTALCGKKWIPGRDPEKYPVCSRCKEIYNSLEGG